MDVETALCTINKLLDELLIDIPRGVISLGDLTPSFWIVILQRLIGIRVPIPGLTQARDRSTRILAMKVFIGTLSADILRLDLSRIDPVKAADGNEEERLLLARYLILAAKKKGYLQEDVVTSTPIKRRPSPAPTSSTAPTTTRDSSRDGEPPSSSATTVPSMDIDEVLSPSSGTTVHAAPAPPGLLDFSLHGPRTPPRNSRTPSPLPPLLHSRRTSERDELRVEDVAETSYHARRAIRRQPSPAVDEQSVFYDPPPANIFRPEHHNAVADQCGRNVSIKKSYSPDRRRDRRAYEPAPPLGWGSGPVRDDSVTGHYWRAQTSGYSSSMPSDASASASKVELRDGHGTREEGYLGLVDDVKDYEESLGSRSAYHSRMSSSSSSVISGDPDPERVYQLLKRKAEILQRIAENKLNMISARRAATQGEF